MISRVLLPVLFGSVITASAPQRLSGQDVTADAVAWRTDDTRTGWRIGIGVPGQGALSTRLYVQHQSHGSSGYRDNGVGVDVTLFERRRQGIYLVAGLGGGLLDPDGAGAIDRRAYWDWSAGLGYELVPVSFFALRGEGRWRTQRPGPEQGLELSVGAVVRLRASRPPRQRAVTVERRMNAPSEGRVVDLARAEGISGDKAQLVADVVATATAAMGTPYQWGGTGSGGSGFDCSGLIQYAYRQHGIQLPRISRDQARVGVAVDKRIEALAPGDILTFSNSGGHVTHVALYVGEGKIIHSASGGVQMSVLSPTDSYGKWWWNRWVGARRVVR